MKLAAKMKQKLTQGPVGQQLVNLTLPMLGGIFAVVAFTLVDTYFVAQLGTSELAAMSFTFPVVIILGNLTFGLGVGVSSVVARAIGEGNRKKVRRLTTDSLTLSLLVVSLIVILGMVTIDPLFRAMGAQSEVLDLVRRYMVIWYPGTLCLVVPMVGNSAIRAVGNTKIPSLIMAIAAGINLVLDPLLIFGGFGFPRLEMEGAAIATVVARAIAMLASLAFLHYRERLISFRWPTLEQVLRSWKSILHVGLPAAGTSTIVPISLGFITSLVALYGPEAVAGFGVASKVEAMASIALLAISASIGPFIGQNWGAQKFRRVELSLRLSFLFCLVWGLLSAIILALASPWIAARFTADAEAIAIATNYLAIVPISYGAFGIVLVSSATFNALGKPFPSVIITATRMLLLYVPLAYLGSKLFGINGIFIAACCSNALGGLGAFLWHRHNCQMITQSKPNSFGFTHLNKNASHL